jgi:hypothetical protein
MFSLDAVYIANGSLMHRGEETLQISDVKILHTSIRTNAKLSLLRRKPLLTHQRIKIIFRSPIGIAQHLIGPNDRERT